jgi:hypothetical protein
MVKTLIFFAKSVAELSGIYPSPGKACSIIFEFFAMRYTVCPSTGNITSISVKIPVINYLFDEAVRMFV